MVVFEPYHFRDKLGTGEVLTQPLIRMVGSGRTLPSSGQFPSLSLEYSKFGIQSNGDSFISQDVCAKSISMEKPDETKQHETVTIRVINLLS